jgi:hypothetical protein
MPVFPSTKVYPKLDAPATYRVRVLGGINAAWSNRLGGMRINTVLGRDKTLVSTLYGRIRDQSELMGILNSLYELHLPILSVEFVHVQSTRQKMG